jgi:hypothetical protein
LIPRSQNNVHMLNFPMGCNRFHTWANNTGHTSLHLKSILRQKKNYGNSNLFHHAKII